VRAPGLCRTALSGRGEADDRVHAAGRRHTPGHEPGRAI